MTLMRRYLSATLVVLATGLIAAPANALIEGTLPRDLSPWGMFQAADIVVKAVMLGLVGASVLTWTIWFAKFIELAARRRAARSALARLGSASALADTVPLTALVGAPADLIAVTQRELSLSHGLEAAGIKERLALAYARIEAGAAQQAGRGMGILATIGATAPFVGLFGTVWGIMNSFIGISHAQTTNLAVVAPGIAEALLATALGLFAAIPAVMIYNTFARSIASYRATLADLSAALLRLAGRELDRGGSKG